MSTCHLPLCQERKFLIISNLINTTFSHACISAYTNFRSRVMMVKKFSLRNEQLADELES